MLFLYLYIVQYAIIGTKKVSFYRIHFKDSNKSKSRNKMSTNIMLMGSPNQRTCRTVQCTFSHIDFSYIMYLQKKKNPIVLVRIKIPQNCNEKNIFFRRKYINIRYTN